jgi:L-ascorbate metabolism protein UlaG (beta-lactamase superfamily)
MLFGLAMVTMDPKQGIEVIRLVKPKTAIPIHYDDYTAFEFALGDSNQPPAADKPELWRNTQITSFKEFIEMAKKASPSSDIKILHRGETYVFDIPAGRR